MEPEVVASPTSVFPAIRVGTTAYGFDGSEVGTVLDVSRRRRILRVETPEMITLILPLDIVGLVGANFVILRGTAAQFTAPPR